MLTNFNRNLELADCLESDYLKLLYYDLSPMSCDYKSYQSSRLCTILEGKKTITVNEDVHFSYEPGQFILLPPHSHVHMDIDVPTKALVFEINDSLIQKVTEKVGTDIEADCDSLKEDRFFLGDTHGGLGQCLRKLTDVSTKPERDREFLIDLYAQEMAYHLIKIKGIQQIIQLERNHPIHKAIHYIQNHIMESISISQLAFDLNMSEANFSNSFKKIVGITPKEFITNLKLAKAKEMLKDQNVTEVAYDLGYENISHFIALFKNKYGITPKQYKSIGKVPVVYQ